MKSKARTGFAIKWKDGETYIGSDGFFAFYTHDKNAATLFETEEAALKWKGDSKPEYIVIPLTIKKPRRIPSLVQPKI